MNTFREILEIGKERKVRLAISRKLHCVPGLIIFTGPIDLTLTGGFYPASRGSLPREQTFESLSASNDSIIARVQSGGSTCRGESINDTRLICA